MTDTRTTPAGEPRRSIGVRALSSMALPGPRRPSWRRATVVGTATWLLSAGHIGEAAWAVVACFFIIGEAVPRAIEAARRGDG